MAPIKLQKMPLDVMLSQIGRAQPLISGSSASLIAGALGVAMIRMALSVSGKHSAENDLAIEKLDSLAARLSEATEQDRGAALDLIETLRDHTDPSARHRAIADATRAPLAAAHLLVELLEHAAEAEQGILPSVASDFFGGIEMVSGAFAGVMMAVDANLKQDEADELIDRTRQNRSTLWSRHDAAMAASTSHAQAQGLRLR